MFVLLGIVLDWPLTLYLKCEPVALLNLHHYTDFILTGSVIFVIGMYYSIKLEHDAGYYECPNCGKRYVPTIKAMLLAPHIMRDRKMKCPYCNQRAYHKKVLTK